MRNEGGKMSALVEIMDMCKIYNPGENEVRALNHVSVTIQEGEFVAIIGQSGSGKSTLMNMLGCLDVPTSGRYMLHGQDVSHMKDNELSDIRNREIGFIFQGFNLIQNLTALENVELPLIYRGVSKGKRLQLAEEALSKVGLENRMDHKPAEMSGGQQQRVAIARAIAQAPPIILADEPTGNLDSGSTKEIMQIMRDLHREGRTVILITHDNEIAAQADRVIKIKDGYIESDTSMFSQTEAGEVVLQQGSEATYSDDSYMEATEEWVERQEESYRKGLEEASVDDAGELYQNSVMTQDIASTEEGATYNE